MPQALLIVRLSKANHADSRRANPSWIEACHDAELGLLSGSMNLWSMTSKSAEKTGWSSGTVQ